MRHLQILFDLLPAGGIPFETLGRGSNFVAMPLASRRWRQGDGDVIEKRVPTKS